MKYIVKDYMLNEMVRHLSEVVSSTHNLEDKKRLVFCMNTLVNLEVIEEIESTEGA
jgi:hypothetical protein